jgi:hypothetical protein
MIETGAFPVFAKYIIATIDSTNQNKKNIDSNIMPMPVLFFCSKIIFPLE